jgi:hypothetical protein
VGSICHASQDRNKMFEAWYMHVWQNKTQWFIDIHLIQSSENPYLMITNCREYLEYGHFGIMRNSKLIHSDLSALVPYTLSIFFTLEPKRMRGFLHLEIGKVAENLEILMMNIAKIDLAQQKCDQSALYWEDNSNLWSISD